MEILAIVLQVVAIALIIIVPVWVFIVQSGSSKIRFKKTGVEVKDLLFTDTGISFNIEVYFENIGYKNCAINGIELKLADNNERSFFRLEIFTLGIDGVQQVENVWNIPSRSGCKKIKITGVDVLMKRDRDVSSLDELIKWLSEEGVKEINFFVKVNFDGVKGPDHQLTDMFSVAIVKALKHRIEKEKLQLEEHKSNQNASKEKEAIIQKLESFKNSQLTKAC